MYACKCVHVHVCMHATSEKYDRVLRAMWLLWAVLCFSALLSFANGGYELRVQLLGYENPSQGCSEADCGDTCCDFNSETPDCSNNSRCDTMFFYCLRALGSTEDGCSAYNGTRESSRNRNDGELDFNQTRLLGLENPLRLVGLTSTWNGVQVYIESRDQDMGGFDLIDVFTIDHHLPIGDSSSVSMSGTNGIMTLELSITAVCESGFSGAMCEEFDDCIGVTCSERGQCANGNGTYHCNCTEGFTGMDCETNIDDCLLDSCNGHGDCQDDINAFSCECDSGFTGDFCQINIDDCVGRNCNRNGLCRDEIDDYTCVCDSGYTGKDCEKVLDRCVGVECSDKDTSIVGPVVGGVVGVVFAIFLILTLIVALLLIVRCKRSHSKSEIALANEHNGTLTKATVSSDYQNGGDTRLGPVVATPDFTDEDNFKLSPDREFHNPIYVGGTSDSVYADPVNLKEANEEAPTHEFDNPVYGSEGDVNMYSSLCEDSPVGVVAMTTGIGPNTYANLSGKVPVELTTVDCERDYDCID